MQGRLQFSLACMSWMALLCHAAKPSKTSKPKTTADDVFYMLGMLQAVVIGPMVLFFLYNVVRDPAFMDVLKGVWNSVRSRTLSDLSTSAPVQHAPPRQFKDPRYTE
ncbi:unnamed protein product [Aphanomyces euteiches]|uniref:Uncharacterized protein n=1 Tax=Aphanomyces euteiches TaxID=100861 RepID=A0A6G0X5F3_9STRA|nr:hypothetical protein Ae201684_008390 [Aphanomyces euteiches]KAH9070413.1 hypothetical protein Ae201684P_002772 [Aphanomyces euteiches]KAH9157072.1 hypothetical protein AeRB84_001046 [Aphanomyces euteiches]